MLCSETTENSEECQVSVRNLKSMFESGNGNNVRNIGNTDSRTSLGSNEASRVPFQRQRSKSESESLAQQSQKPKSVLSKKGKNSDRLNKPRKSVTFCTNVCLVEAGDDWLGGVIQTGYQSDEEEGPDSQQISTRRTDDTDSSTSDSPVEMIGDSGCILCHKQGVEQGQNYCSKCTYYMSKFAPSRWHTYKVFALVKEVKDKKWYFLTDIESLNSKCPLLTA